MDVHTTGHLTIDSEATIDSGECEPYVYGCTDEDAFNYNENANTDDGSCIDKIFGCMDSTLFNYNAYANTADDSCIEFIYGCIDPAAYNPDADANTDDGSCIPVISGCTDVSADNYVYPVGNAMVDINTSDSDACIFYGCTYVGMFNYDAQANTNDGSCYAKIFGCTDATADNFVPLTGNVHIDVNTDDGSCLYTPGCMVDTMFNHNPLADYDDGSCEPYKYGCLIESMFNYSDTVNTDDGSCYPVSLWLYRLFG